MFLFTFIGIQKRILQISITSINENFQTSQYKKLSKTFFEYQISFKSSDFVIYYIEYIKSLGGENSLYLVFNNVDAYIESNSTQKSNENKYLIFTSTHKNKEALENYTELWDEIKDQVKQ